MTELRVALDTNVLVYAESAIREPKRAVAQSLLLRIPKASIVLPVQVIGELFNVLVRKAGLPPAHAGSIADTWRETASLVDTSAAVMASALDIAREHHFGIWDSVVIAAADHGGCRLLLSEDMHEGFSWSGVTITNPFAATRHPILDRLLS